MYMANANYLCWGPNATYIPVTVVGVLRWGNANFRFCVGGNANCVFRYQHFSIPNEKFWPWRSRPTQGPNAKILHSSGIWALEKILLIL